MKPTLVVLCLACLALAGCFFFSPGDTSKRAVPGTGVSADTGQAKATEKAGRPVMTRDQFKAAVMGKTPEQVIAAVGKPDDTSESGHVISWRYYGRTKDKSSEKPDYSAALRIKDGVVTSVDF